MRLLALKTSGFVLPFIHSSMIKAFRSLGVDVWDTPIPSAEEEFATFLKTLKNRFDVGFILDMGIEESFIQKFKNIQITFKIPWIIWFVDDPGGYAFPDACLSEWTYAFCWDREICNHLSEASTWKGRPLIYLPLASSPEDFFPTNPRPGLIFPGGIFVGATRHENPFLEKAAAAIPGLNKDEIFLWESYSKNFRQPLQDLIWGYLAKKAGKRVCEILREPLARLWVYACAFRLGAKKRKEVAGRILEEGAIFGDEGWRVAMPSLYRGTLSYPQELWQAYNQSSFVLDIRQPQARTGLTQRIFDASACGIPVLTEGSPELEILFEPEQELWSYQTIEEGIQNRDELLRSYEKARKKAEKARNRVLCDHTYRNRALRILQALRSKST